jgi:hypothetical protein
VGLFSDTKLAFHAFLFAQQAVCSCTSVEGRQIWKVSAGRQIHESQSSLRNDCFNREFRGKEAMDRLKTASPDVKAPAAGSEYVLARVKFELKGRYVSDTMAMDIGKDPLQWISLSGTDLTENDRVSVTVPKPALEGRVKPGGSIEGWLAFPVKQNDSKPVMVFDPDTGGATGRGKTVFFKLYQ